MKLCLLYLYQNWLMLLQFKPVQSVLQIPSDTVTQITQVSSGAILIYFGTDMVNIFPWMMQVIIIKRWIIKLLKTICFGKQFIGNQSMKCTLLHPCDIGTMPLPGHFLIKTVFWLLLTAISPASLTQEKWNQCTVCLFPQVIPIIIALYQAFPSKYCCQSIFLF